MSRLQTRTIVVAALLAVSVGLLALNQMGRLEGVKAVLRIPLTALQRSVTGITAGVGGLFGPSGDAAALQARIEALEAENVQLRAENSQLKEDTADLQLLTALLDFERTIPDNRYAAANVIGRDSSPFLGYIMIDLGSDAGLAREMPVVTQQGLVGTIVQTTCCAAVVRLVTDAESAVNARLQTSRDEGIAVGNFSGGLELQFLAQQATVTLGDTVLTSGLGGTYPEGLVLGTVSAVQRQDYEVLQKAILTPAVDFTRLEIVLVIIDFQPVDLSPLILETPAAPPP
ncbi:MAG: rod shape-determining protein MreC [Anaerolineales bacterium]|nr:rod shape-determining protein MreC [Anaerolineales bacterium]